MYQLTIQLHPRSGTDLTSLPMILTAFAAAFLGSLVAPILTSGLVRMLNTDEFKVPDIELPRIIRNGGTV